MIGRRRVYHPPVTAPAPRRQAPARLALACLALAAAADLQACAGAPPAPTPPPPVVEAPPPPPALPPLPTGAAALDEAARLLADGVDLPMVVRLLEQGTPGDPRRDVLAGQLAELTGDDAAAEAAYRRALAVSDDDEVRLRRALVLERLGRGEEARADLERLRAARPASAATPGKRKLRPLLPSAR